MKCIRCRREFEMTEREARHNEYLPFCSRKCYVAALHDGECHECGKSVKERLYHVGETAGRAPRAGHGGAIEVRPFTARDRERAARLAGRETFSRGATVCILPSAALYGAFPKGGAK